MRACCLALALVLGAVPANGQEKHAPRFTEQVDVERALVDARVLDHQGLPLLGLDADDFSVKIGGKPVPIESIMWVGGEKSDGARSTDDVGPGRLIIFLLQKDFERSRLAGLMRMLIESQRFIDELTPRDRVAVLSFDSHLKIWLDFTNDGEAVRRVLQRSILFEDPPLALETSSAPSLAAGLDPGTASKTYTIEKALHGIADAVRDLPGSKRYAQKTRRCRERPAEAQRRAPLSAHRLRAAGSTRDLGRAP
jgi:hypothetical protein